MLCCPKCGHSRFVFPEREFSLSVYGYESDGREGLRPRELMIDNPCTREVRIGLDEKVVCVNCGPAATFLASELVETGAFIPQADEQ